MPAQSLPLLVPPPLRLGPVPLQECNAAIHKKCIDKIIGRCTGTATNSRDTIVSWAQGAGVWGPSDGRGGPWLPWTLWGSPSFLTFFRLSLHLAWAPWAFGFPRPWWSPVMHLTTHSLGELACDLLPVIPFPSSSTKNASTLTCLTDSRFITT